MKIALSGFSDSTLVDRAKVAARNERGATSILVAYIAEIDARRIYAAAGYSSMRAWCVAELGLCEQDAARRIGAARAARRFPVIIDALAEGRLHLTAVNLLSPWLTEANAAEMLAAAEHKTRTEIEELLARRFPRADTPTSITPLAAPAPQPPALLATAPVHEFRQPLSLAIAVAGNTAATGLAPSTGLSGLAATQPAHRSGRVTPLSAERLELKTTISRETNEKLRRAQELLGHRVTPGDVAAVLDRALDALIERLEKQKYATTDKPRASRPRSQDSRHIPAEVRRAVRERDQDRCTYVSPDGKRCEERSGIEIDHIEPYARGGEATVANLRLRCRTHNQLEAERAYGSKFIRNKRKRRLA